MTDEDIDRRLGRLLARPAPAPDPAFVDRVLVAAEFDRKLSASRRRSLLRALVECAVAAAVGATFYLMSQLPGSEVDGFIVPGGPAMAGLVMLLLWSVIAIPSSPNSRLDLLAWH